MAGTAHSTYSLRTPTLDRSYLRSAPEDPSKLYLAYTNVVAFRPTAIPSHLAHRVKGLMAIQSMISLAVLVVVISRVINILPS